MRTVASGLLVLLMLVSTGAATAQQVTYFEIRDGNFILNGKALDNSKVPESLDASGLSASFSFFGDSHPVIEIGGRYFVLEESTIREATEEDLTRGDANVFLTDGELRSKMIQDAYRVQVNALRENARKLEQYSATQPIQSDDEAAQILSEAQRYTALAASTAEQLPKAEMQQYMENLRFRDGELYSRFNRELNMEIQAREMATRIRNLPESRSDEREALVVELRKTLEEIYVLKQANRKREIVELQLQLEALEKNMRDREKYKTEIIERRLQELIGADPARW